MSAFRINTILALSLLTLMAGYQNCAPASFGQLADPSEKAAGIGDGAPDDNQDDQPDSITNGDGTPPPQIGVVKDPTLGEVPIVRCPKVREKCPDHEGESVSESPNALTMSHGGKSDFKRDHHSNEDEENCAVICHLPSGDMAKAKTLYVGLSAAHAHVMNHGDLIGACE